MSDSMNPLNRTQSVPTDASAQFMPSIPDIQTSQSTSTKLTSSDKLTALPTMPSISSPVLDRYRNTSRQSQGRRSLDQGSMSEDSGRSTPILTPVMGRSPSQVAHKAGRNSEESVTGRGRVSFEGDRHTPSSIPYAHNSIAGRLAQALSSGEHLSTPKLPDSAKKGRKNSRSRGSSPSPSAGRGRGRSSSPGRSMSPLRFIPALIHRVTSRPDTYDEPFVAVNPFRFHWLGRHASESHEEVERDAEIGFDDHFDSRTHYLHLDIKPTLEGWLNATSMFIVMVSRQIYLHLLLRMPSLYWARVARVFEDAELSQSEMAKMIAASRGDAPNVQLPLGVVLPAATAAAPASDAPGTAPVRPTLSGSGRRLSARQHWSKMLPCPEDWTPPNVSPAMARFKNSWEALIDSVLREWKTLNIVSTLLLSGIISLLQVETAAADPVTRTAALFSLICALFSLIYGALFVIRFGTMRSMYKASRWAAETKRNTTGVLWNVWVMLALPAVWLSWSLVAFLVAILGWVWRTAPEGLDADISASLDVGVRLTSGQTDVFKKEVLAARIAVTALFGLGMVYVIAIIVTFSAYGDEGDGWQEAVSFQQRMRRHERQPETVGRNGEPVRVAKSEPSIHELAAMERERRPNSSRDGNGTSIGLGLGQTVDLMQDERNGRDVEKRQADDVPLSGLPRAV